MCVSVGGPGSGWMMNRISNGFNFYFNVDTMEHSWQLPESAELDPSLLTHADIQVSELPAVAATTVLLTSVVR